MNKIYLYGAEDGTVYYSSDGYRTRKAKLHFRHERTWDDHMGNTPCGYYFIATLPNSKTKRIYLCEFHGDECYIR